MGASLTTSIRELETCPKPIVRYAMPIDILWETKAIDQSSRTVSPILLSSPTSQAHPFEDEESVAQTGQFSLMTITQDLIYIDNESYVSYVLCCGTTEFTNQSYLASNAYANADIIFTAMKAMGREKVPINIDFRLFEDNSLDITTEQANTWTVIITALIPVIVCVLGITVFIQRKHL